MKKHILASLLCSIALPAMAAQEYTPGAPSLGEQLVGAFQNLGSGTPPYTPPAMVAGLAIAYGDSRTANAGGVAYSGTSFVVNDGFSNTFVAEIPWQSNNAVQFSYHYNYGVGAQSTAGIYSRLNLSAALCNSANLTSAAGQCFTANKTTTSGSSTAGLSAITLTTAAGVSNNDYIFTSPASPGSGLYLLPQTQVTNIVTNTLSINQTIQTTIPNLTTFMSAAAAKINPFWNGLDGTQLGWTLTDPQLNSNNTGQYSTCSDPAPLVFLTTGTNDSTLPTLQSLKNEAAMLDGLGPTGCNKVVIFGNEVPRGAATAIVELHTIPTTPFQVTSNHAGVFYKDIQVVYAPPNTANVLGTNDGTVLTSLSYPCTPATGQYCVNPATGIYTFASGDSGAQVAIDYRYAALPGATYLTDIHEWANSSSASPFVAPTSGNSYAIAGALYNRPWVVHADTWDAVLDSGSGALLYPNNYASVDGLHPLPAGGTKISQVLANAAATYVGTTPVLALPTQNNIDFSGNSYASGTVVTNTCGLTGSNKQFQMNTLVPAASSGIYSVGMKIYTTSGNVPAGDPIVCVDTTNNVIQLTNAATVTSANSSIYGQVDTNSIAVNGLISHLDVPASPPVIASCNTHCGTPSSTVQTVPLGWLFSVGASQTTDLNSGILGVNYGIETNTLGDGYDSFVIQIQGQITTGALAVVFQTANLAGVSNNLITSGDKHRLGCLVTVSAGPNGHLSGAYWPQLAAFENVGSGTYTPPGGANGSFTNWSSQVGGGGTGIEMSDGDLANGVSGKISATLFTPNTDTTGMTTPTNAIKITLGSDAPTIQGGTKLPVSETVRISRCTMQKVTN